MKMRQGFVSNSSSSNFVVPVGTFETVFDIARNMLANRDFGTEQQLLDLLNRSGGMDSDTPVAFRSCNYDTFIAKDGEFFLIQTCWNHPWDIKDFALPWSEIPWDIKDRYFKDPDGESLAADYEFLDIAHEMDFWLLDHNLHGRPLRLKETGGQGVVCVMTGKTVRGTDLFCLQCYSEYWEIDGEITCPSCSRGISMEAESEARNE